MKQLIINGKKSYDDFGVYISTRSISQPTKKVIKESVPFTNIVYDFSDLNGEVYWDERILTYTFDIAELSTDEMEVVKTNLLNWLLNVHDVDIYDPYIGDYHFHGSYDSNNWVEDFGAAALTINFSVYPYKISNKETKVLNTLTSGANNISVINNSSHKITPIFECSNPTTIKIGTSVYSLQSGATTNDSIKLEAGINDLIVTPTKAGDTLTIKFKEEVF